MERREREEDVENQPLGNGGGSNHTVRRSTVNTAIRIWPTVDGPLGLSEEDSIGYARSFFKWGFFFLPLLWAVNCFYFWPVLRSSYPATTSTSFRLIRPYVVGSAVGFVIFAVLLSSWALTFVVGGESLFGPTWGSLVMYNVADRYGLTAWD